MNWEGGSSFDQMVRDSIDDLFTEVLFRGIFFFSLFLFRWGMNRKTIQCSGEMWDGFGWFLMTGENPACLYAGRNGLVRRGKSECQTAGKLQHNRDRREPQEHNHILCSM